MSLIESDGDADLDTKVSSNKEKKNVILYPCDHCEYKGTRSGLYQHKISKHQDISYYCDLCDFASSSQHYLKRHKKIKHEERRYPCDQCEYAATQLGVLRQHKEAVHEGIRYPCVQCDYAATQPSALRRHMRSQHDITLTDVKKIKQIVNEEEVGPELIVPDNLSDYEGSLQVFVNVFV